jgi:ornithine carbamoyltransferase
MSMTVRHFLDLSDISAADARAIIDRARALKKDRFQPLLTNKKLAMIFDKHSTRTRVSFEVAMLELGGHALCMAGNEVQSRGEIIADTARVLSRYVDAILLRCESHEKLKEMARYATVPVINGLTEFSHPCQILTDILTFEEHLGPIKGKTIAWVGDGNNMAQTWVHASALFGFTLHLACPKRLQPLPEVMTWGKKNGGSFLLTDKPEEAVRGADAVTADTWVSISDSGSEEHIALLKPYQVNEKLMSSAAKHAIFLHCLPAHRGEEVTAGVIDGPQSKIFDEAENRLHAQKAILLWCLKN